MQSQHFEFLIISSVLCLPVSCWLYTDNFFVYKVWKNHKTAVCRKLLLPYFPAYNARVIYTKRIWNRKKWTCAVYVR